MQRTFFLSAVAWLCLTLSVQAQISSFPYVENFDSDSTLPSGWTTSSVKSAGGDFSVTKSSARSSPNALLSSDATKQQWLVSPQFNFTGKIPDSIEFYERRSASHTSDVLLEASTDGGVSFSLTLSDSMKLASSTAYIKRIFPLPPSLNNQPNVRFRWRIVGNGSGATGTYRIDDVALRVKKSLDLALSSVSASPAFPKSGETIVLTAGITNKALAGNFSFDVQLYDSTRLISALSTSKNLSAQETTAVQILYPNISAGKHSLTVQLLVLNDEDVTNNSLSLTVNADFAPRTVFINEFMYAPPAGMPEWIECVNNSDSVISLSGWKVSDAGATKAAITSGAMFIPKKTYFIITTDTAALKTFYLLNAPLFQAQFSALNNTTADAVVLYGPFGGVIDSVYYSPSWGGANGISLERIDTALGSNLQANWKPSKNIFGATPGYINSVTQKNFDLEISSVTFLPALPVSDDVVTARLTIKNIGKQPVNSAVLSFYLNARNDSLRHNDEKITEQILSLLNPNDSVTISVTLPHLPQGAHQSIAFVQAPADDDTTNNMFVSRIITGIAPRSIVINEIMYAPIGDMPEWVELYNTSAEPISLSQWKISDAGTTKALLNGRSSAVPSHSFVIVTTDTTALKNYFSFSVPLYEAKFGTLNNTTPDAVVLYDDRGAPIDSVYYKPIWGGINGKSLQRFDLFSSSTDSANWISDIPSPGAETIAGKKDFDVMIESITALQRSSGILFQSTIKNIGRKTAAAITLKIFYDANKDSLAHSSEEIISFTLDSIASGNSTLVSYQWNNTSPGRHQFIFEAKYPQDENTRNNLYYLSTANSYAEQSIVFNEILYEPSAGNAEFVELYNTSGDSIDVNNWMVMDQPSSSGSRTKIFLSSSQKFLLPNDYFVIASDSTIFSQFPLLKKENVLVHSSLNLNNSGEDLLLVDLTGTQIDSLRYSPLWHLKNINKPNRSLERILPLGKSTDSKNWSSSVAPMQATPGTVNSIYVSAAAASSALSLSPNPFSPDNDGVEDFLTISYTLPSQSSMIRVRIYDVQGRIIRRLASNEPSASSGTLIWNGLDDNGIRVRVGMYIILFEALDNFGGVVRTQKDVAVVARKL